MIVVHNHQLKEVENINGLIDREGAFYEVIRVIKGIPLFLEEHLKRLKTGVGVLDDNLMKKDLELLIKASHYPSQNIYICFNQKTKESLIYFVPSFYPPKSWFSKGIEVILLSVQRENPNSKVENKSYKELVKKRLEEADVFEALLTDGETIKEGSRSNVFFISGNKLLTPLGKDVLLGVTRLKVNEICLKLGIEIEERPIKISELKDFAGVFLTGTSIDLLPVSTIENHSFTTASNPLFLELAAAYEEEKRLI